MTDGEDFLKVLAENPDDDMTRMIYADWLDEAGEYEEAERQRAWPEAKSWMMNFADANDRSLEEPDYYGKVDYDFLMNLAQQIYDDGVADLAAGGNGYAYAYIGNKEYLEETIRAVQEDFWKNWSILTGNKLPDEWDEDRVGFSCSC